MTWTGQEVGAGLAVLDPGEVTLGQVDEAALPQLAEVADQRLEAPACRLRGRARSKGALPLHA
jgi:hypothetical protein